jgi:competence protein ComEA
MIHLIKRYWKFLICALVLLVMLFFCYFYYQKNNTVSTPIVKKLSLSKEENDSKTVFVDVKGAVNAPGVYELDEGKRVIDAINTAGGLTDAADTINLNLSKKLTDEMYIVVYTEDEIYNYKNNNDKTEEIICASFECVCPDTKNDACIVSDDSKNTSSKNEEKTGKVSINSASKDELMSLSGIGDAKADAIIKYRDENGGFKAIEDIKNVSGIGDSVYEKIKDNITL